MPLSNIYLVALAASFVLGTIWSVVDKQKPPKAWEFIAKLIVRSLFLFVLIVIVIGFFALLQLVIPKMLN